MKKFLSLVLALIMTMSLVTIGASAAEYDDFTDKSEIKYEEAVAVLNKLGIITGYSEGDFRPEGELTRGAAAKIIVSLLIGPEAANNVSPTSAPYKDVPLDHTFAGVIAYCKTANIISGYGDGSFQPGGTLTGYAFSKMLLGALGYKSDVERFTGAGWNMNVNARAAEAGLFDRISFKGNEPVNREEAAQLALNTLKATMVEYTGGFTVNAGDASVTGAQTRSYKVSNQEFASHINNKKAGGAGSNTNYDKDNWYTVEFGEEHFVDLRMIADGSTIDEFGRPSNEWSYKKVTIGTFPIEPDFTFTTQVINHNGVNVTPAQMERALGLSSYDYKSDNNVKGTIYVNGRAEASLNDVADIANWTDNGTLVEVYVDEDDADWIRYVVVSQSQLMEVDRIGSDYVALDRVEADGNNDGFNAVNIDKPVLNVEDGDEAYAVVKDLKAGDKVVIIPVADDHNSNTYKVSRAYVPETAKGALTAIERFSDTTEAKSDTVEVTVGGTKYPVSNWNKDLIGITRDSLKITNKDVTLTLDEYGNALRAEDVGETSDFMIVGSYSRGIANSREVTFVEGWDIAGNKVSLNLGNSAGTNARDAERDYKPGDLVRYTNVVDSSTAEWKLDETGVYDLYNGSATPAPNTETDANRAINTNDQYIKVTNPSTATAPTSPAGWATWKGGTTQKAPYADKGIVFIYVAFNSDNEVDSIEIAKGMQNVTYGEVRSYWNPGVGVSKVSGNDHNWAGTNNYNGGQACVKLSDGQVKDNSGVKAVVIKSDSSSSGSRNILYVRSQTNTSAKDENGKVLNGYTVAMLGDDGSRIQETTIYSEDKLNAGMFARWTKVADSERDDVYDLHIIDTDHMSTSSAKAVISGSANIFGANKEYIRLNANGANYTGWGSGRTTSITPAISAVGNLDETDTINTKNAFWVDMIDKGGIKDGEDLQDLMKSVADGGKNWDDFKVSFVFNDNKDNDNFRSVAMIVVEGYNLKHDAAAKPTAAVTATPNTAVELNEKVTLTATPAPGTAGYGVLTYKWEKSADDTVWTVISGATDSTYVADTSTAGTTYYRVTITNTDTSKESDYQTATSNPSASVSVVVNPDTTTQGYDLDINGLTITLIQAPGADDISSDAGAVIDMVEALMKAKGMEVTGIKADSNNPGCYLITANGREYTVDPTDTVTQIKVYINGTETTVASGAKLNATDSEGDAILDGKYVYDNGTTAVATTVDGTTAKWKAINGSNAFAAGHYYYDGYYQITSFAAATVTGGTSSAVYTFTPTCAAAITDTTTATTKYVKASDEVTVAVTLTTVATTKTGTDTFTKSSISGCTIDGSITAIDWTDTPNNPSANDEVGEITLKTFSDNVAFVAGFTVA